MDDDVRADLAALALVTEKLNPDRGIYYLSFVDESGWLGGCFVAADGPVTAVQISHRHGINPGGEVAIWGLGPTPLPDHLMNRLLSREEVEIDPFAEEDAG